MAVTLNLKNDLLDVIATKRQFKQAEFIRLANDPNTNYEDKVSHMLSLAEEIANCDLQVNVINFYFKDQQESAPAPAQNGQSHRE
jgi:hypothetical protein